MSFDMRSWGPTQATLMESDRRARRRGWGSQTILLVRQSPTIKMIGKTPRFVLCSRNSLPEKGLVRRPHVDQHGCPSKRGEASKLGRNNYIDGGSSMRAVKDSPAVPRPWQVAAPEREGVFAIFRMIK